MPSRSRPAPHTPLQDGEEDEAQASQRGQDPTGPHLVRGQQHAGDGQHDAQEHGDPAPAHGPVGQRPPRLGAPLRRRSP